MRGFLVAGLRLLIGGIFIYAGATKLGSPAAFAGSLETFELLPNLLISVTALSLPVFEILVGGLTIVGPWRHHALKTLQLLTIVFCLFLIQAIFRGLPVDCGCFGSKGPTHASAWLALGRNLILILLMGWLQKMSQLDGTNRQAV